MCHKIKTLAKNVYGQLSYCQNCDIYHLTFSNIYIELTPEEMVSFQKYVTGIDIEYWETKIDTIPTKRKIVINTLQHNLCLLFNRPEFEAFKALLFESTKKPNDPLNVLGIDYDLILN
jgi:hypothetical protein